MDSIIGSISVKKIPRVIVRCSKNPYNTPLFSFDSAGIYVKCKDCRIQGPDGKFRRGAFHLYTWGMLFRMALGLDVAEEVVEHVASGGDSSGDHNTDDEPAAVGVSSEAVSERTDGNS